MIPQFSTFMTIFAVGLATMSVNSAAPVRLHAAEPFALTIDELKAAGNSYCPDQTSGEVISCQDALPYINEAINKYNLVTKAQRAAYLSTMFYESATLKYNHNLVNPTQGTRSMLPQASLERFVSANVDVQSLVATYPTGTLIVDILINNHLDFQPGAWWTTSGPECPEHAAALDGSSEAFLEWEIECINGGVETLQDRATAFETVYQAIH
ncbi:hypothetical protein BGX23_006638 [Mortierella sp. AD031]|nr:hypothetical protein BGX23_006638 [Mortierella sp. AD031]